MIGLSVESYSKDMKRYMWGDTADPDKEFSVESKHLVHIEKDDKLLPKMYTWDFIGLYCHYAAVGHSLLI